MLVIGLTGGFGSGKSTVAAMLKALGATLVDADRVGHETYRAGTAAWREIVRAFGRGVVGADGEIDRRRLGAIVFNEPARMAELTAIVWPRIGVRLRARAASERRRGAARALVIEAAVLFEAGWDGLCDEVWTVEASEKEIIDRVSAGRGMSAAQTRARLHAQLSPDERVARANVVISNHGSLEALRTEVKRTWDERVMSKA